MRKGILGRKIGMTQVFAKNGKLVPVTVISVEPNVVSQIKTIETDGYEAIQLAFDTKREKLANKPELGHLKKANTSPKRFLKEIRGVDVTNYTLGQELKADIFAEGEMVDVTGTSKGKGYQGVIKKYSVLFPITLKKSDLQKMRNPLKIKDLQRKKEVHLHFLRWWSVGDSNP